MASFRLRHFTNAGALRAVRPHFLMALVGKHADYFASRGVDFGAFNGAGPDYEAMARVLMAPEEPPGALIDDLYYVDEMATPAGMDALLEAAQVAKLPLDLDGAPTPADVAVQVRLLAPGLLEEKHAEQVLLDRKRTFVYFQPRDGAETQYRAPTAARVRAFEEALGARLELMKRGAACRLFTFPRPDGVWLLVWRGDPYKREGAIEKTKTTSVYYRPEKYDVLKYDEALGELSINAEGNKTLTQHYRELVGVLLFDDAKHFPDTAKFTLAPLQDVGAEALVSSDVEGIDSVVLKEVQVYWGGAYGETTTHRARNLFAVWAAQGRPVSLGRLVRASFLIRFAGQKTPRTVTIRPSNVASYARNEDAPLVEEWLSRRGFIKTPMTEPQDADAASTAAVA